MGSAMLSGQFRLHARVTAAKDIRGEHVGQRFGRTWTFTPLCANGDCTTVELVRPRAGGTDTVLLDEIVPGQYYGSGSFYAPLRCAGRTYRKGEFVPFAITVTVTAATVVSNVDVATSITATYTNNYRENLTECVDVPGHDAAVYQGQLLPPPSGGGAV
jgi:hypothetical protein